MTPLETSIKIFAAEAKKVNRFNEKSLSLDKKLKAIKEQLITITGKAY
jgi:hypothetical protein